MAHDKSQTPPSARRARKGTRTGTVEVGLTSDSAAALRHLVQHLQLQPHEKYPANNSGAVRLALDEAAARRGFKPPGE